MSSRVGGSGLTGCRDPVLQIRPVHLGKQRNAGPGAQSRTWRLAGPRPWEEERWETAGSLLSELVPRSCAEASMRYVMSGRSKFQQILKVLLLKNS